MNAMSKTAKILDKICGFIYWLLIIVTVISLIGVGLLVAAAVFYENRGKDLDPDRLGNNGIENRIGCGAAAAGARRAAGNRPGGV